MRSVIIPVIEDEVNNGESFANLRQMYHAMILAYWFKQNLKKSLLGQVYVDRKKVSGIDSPMLGDIENIYQQYVGKFRDGAFDLIKEDYDPQTQEMVTRKYFSGGTDWTALTAAYQPTTDATVLGVIGDNPQIGIKFGVSEADFVMLQIDSERVALEILRYARSDAHGVETLGRIEDEASWKTKLQQELNSFSEKNKEFKVNIPWTLGQKRRLSKITVALNDNNFLQVTINVRDLQPRIFMVNLENFQMAAEVASPVNQAMLAKVEGIPFFPKMDFP
ncbi:MAG: hypothetical protein COW13_02775, partial [Candidatus Omnitrophica bacterium CG12_big_fil_rev_8_21_14_0_65_50_5]